MSPFSFRPQVEQLDGRCLPSANPAITINDVAVAEGNSGSGYVVLTASLSAPSTKTVKVDYKTANGTAVAGGDYGAVSGTLTFAPGQSRATFGVLVHGDTQAEPDETFSVRLTNARNATIADGTAVLTLLDDGDAKPSLSISDAAAAKGGYLTFTLSLSTPFTQPVTVDYADEWGNRGTLSFAPGRDGQGDLDLGGPRRRVLQFPLLRARAGRRHAQRPRLSLQRVGQRAHPGRRGDRHRLRGQPRSVVVPHDLRRSGPGVVALLSRRQNAASGRGLKRPVGS
jgi:hypothetical protein